MNSHRLLPGPVGTSCLTCRRRHKKCDKRKPVCERCSLGGHECLGYNRNRLCSATRYKDTLSHGIRASKPMSSSSLLPHVSVSSPVFDGAGGSGNDELSTQNRPHLCKDTENDPCIHGINETTKTLMKLNTAHPSRPDIHKAIALYGSDALTYNAFPPIGHDFSTQATETGPKLLPTADTTLPHQHALFLGPPLFALAYQIPKDVPSPSDIGEVAIYVKSQADRMLGLLYFKPSQEQIDISQRISMWRLSICDFARRGMLIEAKITDSMLEGTDTVYRDDFTLWLEEFEQEVRARLAQPLTSYEFQERLADVLETMLLKGALFDSSTTYHLFCRATPSFLQMVHSDSALQPAGNYSASVSMAHLLASPRYGPACFMLMDIIGSMVYGFSQRVEYDTDIEPFHHEHHPVELMNCFPGEFQILLAKINNCRDRGAAVGDWQNIEQRLLSWTSGPKFGLKGEDSWKLIAWVAVQETWRQTLLIYLYLAVCGVPTDDQRIQSSLRQLFQLMGVIRRQNPPVANVHFFAQCLIAGICSQTEKRRWLVRERLGHATETRFWVFRGLEVVPVLEHLWQGAASGGRAVTWNDYIHSRRATLPLSS
ncbi:unnamed protein product [Rhizoctonia solani]|uniref:Zn(2)-C6 fungal-type domain-containing protein n=1 Tax=Rhizoctonia solani TaxID=456999 RepID=A0A8H3GAU2_9AGAM|nr:unnamed protein product [Rhizoctonia solani]